MTNVACAFLYLLIFMFKMADIYIFQGQNFLDPVYIHEGREAGEGGQIPVPSCI